MSLGIALLTIVVLAAPAGADTLTIPQGASDRCLECHAKPDLGTIEVNGETKSLTVSEDDPVRSENLTSGWLSRARSRNTGYRAGWVPLA